MPPDARAVVLAVYIINSGFAGDFQFAEGLLEDVLELAARVPAGTGHPFVALVEPVVMMFRDDSAQGAAAIERRSPGRPEPGRGHAAVDPGGYLRENDGDLDGLLAAQEAAADAFREVGERWGLSMTLASIADARARARRLRHRRGAVRRVDRAAPPARAAPASRISGSGWPRCAATPTAPATARAELRRFAGEPDRTAARHLPRDAGARPAGPARPGDLDEAERCYQERGGGRPSRLVAPQYRAIVLVAMAQLDLRRGDPRPACGRLAQALELAVPARDMPVVAQIAIGSAALAVTRGEPVAAAELLGVARQFAGGDDLSNEDLGLQSAALRDALGAGRVRRTPCAAARSWTADASRGPSCRRVIRPQVLRR